MEIHPQIPEKLEPLLQPSRYKAAYGGRGGAKSHFFGQLATIKNWSQPLRGVCIREVQNSIKDSVKQLIEGKIQEFGLGDFFDVLEQEIRGANGSLIIFRGMQSYNAENIKSLEAFDWAWVEEAQSLSARSLRLLRPTIRKPESELWFSWNPRHDTDPVDKFFRGANKPKNSIIVDIGWQDNPWFPDVLVDEKDQDMANDEEMAEHVWGGGYEIITEGAYYARQLAQAETDGRVGHFPYNPKLKLRTAWDLGIDDYTAIWFIQDDGIWATVVDFYEVGGDGYDDIIATCMPELFMPPDGDPRFIDWSMEKALEEIGRDEPFKYHSHFLPHDVRVREQGSGGRHRFQIMQGLGMKQIEKGVATAPDERVSASRQLLPRMRFNMTPRVEHGIKRLRRYSRKFNEQIGTYQGPLHDENSHAADAFGEYALNCELLPMREKKKKPKPLPKAIQVTEIQPGMVRTNIDPDQRKLNPKEFIQMIKKDRNIGA